MRRDVLSLMRVKAAGMRSQGDCPGAQLGWSAGQGYTWTAESRIDNTVIGQVSLVQLDDDRAWSLAFWTHPDCWG